MRATRTRAMADRMLARASLTCVCVLCSAISHIVHVPRVARGPGCYHCQRSSPSPAPSASPPLLVAWLPTSVVSRVGNPLCCRPHTLCVPMSSAKPRCASSLVTAVRCTAPARSRSALAPLRLSAPALRCAPLCHPALLSHVVRTGPRSAPSRTSPHTHTPEAARTHASACPHTPRPSPLLAPLKSRQDGQHLAAAAGRGRSCSPHADAPPACSPRDERISSAGAAEDLSRPKTSRAGARTQTVDGVRTPPGVPPSAPRATERRAAAVEVAVGVGGKRRAKAGAGAGVSWRHLTRGRGVSWRWSVSLSWARSSSWRWPIA